MTPLQKIFHETEDKMKRYLVTLKREFGELRGGRANPTMVEHVTVDYYGANTAIKQLAAVTAPEPRMLVIQPWDTNALGAIEKAIQKAELGITPVVDGKIVRLPVPPLTGERRAELVKVAHRMAEEGRVHLRNVRREANETVKKLKQKNEATEDDVKEAQTKVQQITNQYVDEIGRLVKSKEHELQAV